MGSGWQEPLHWASHSYRLVAPNVSVRGRMALFLFLAVAWAVSWLLWRAYSVVLTPNDVLVDKLGLDIPPSPNVTLEYISTREVQISWNHADPQNTVSSHVIEVNGKVVGETKRNETTASVLNLIPGTVYDIRILNISAAGFQTPSLLLRIRTSPGLQPPSQDNNSDEAITIRAYSSKPASTHAQTSVPMAREHSGGHPISRRSTTGRRVSPSILQQDLNAVQLDDSRSATDDEMDGNLAQLSERLQAVQQDIDTTENQIVDDEKEFEESLRELETKRDDLKQQLKERDDVSSELRKQVHKAEAASRTALSEKSKKERILHQRENQRKKRKDEIARWDDQTSSMAEEMAGIETQKAAIEKRTQSEIREIRRKIEEEKKEVRTLDEENKDRARQVKALEEERQEMNVDDETDESREADRLERERDILWQERLTGLTSTYRGLYSALQQAQQQYDIARERLAWCESARRATAASFAPGLAPIDMDAIRRSTKPPRKPRHTPSLTSSVSSPRGVSSYDSYTSTAPYSTAINASPTLAGPSFFNAKNGMTINFAPLESSGEKQDDIDLTGGAPMSPRADSLLPADLLGDESADDIPEEDEMPTNSIGDERSRAPFPRLGPPSLRETENLPGSPSPISSSSKSLSSPRESFANIHDSDRASLQSGRDSFQQHAEDDPQTNSRKLMSNLFTFNRQRGKTLAEEPPLLGSLKSGQSQSFPRKFGEEDLDPITQRRRRLSYGGNWAFPGGLLPRSSTDKDLERPSGTRRALPFFSNLGRSSAATASYDPFAARSSSNDPAIRIDGSSSRPSSVYSFDKMPRPSMESQFHAWGPEKSGLRGSPLGPDWASTYSAVSRHQSRRPSIHHGSTSNLSLNLPADADFLESDEPQRSLQAPIGTRPASSQRPLTPKLNPAAPSFTTLFNKRSDKSKDKGKSKDKSIDVSDNASPPDSRKSKETPSLAATTSTADSRDSLERTPSGLSGSGTPAEATPAKPTFISKITRKASSNKFGSWKLTRKDALSTPTNEVDDDANGSFEQLGKSLESTSTTPNGEEKDKKISRANLTWGFIRGKKKGGREDLTASEVSESSERASELGETEEEDDRVAV